MRIAVYPGSFDPLHIGHLAILEYLTTDAEFDMVYLIVSPQNPFKSPEKAANAAERYRAAAEAVGRHPELRVKVDDIELSMPAPQYTIRTLDALREREPGNEFSLVMGADNLGGLLRWKDAGRILREYGVTVYPRRGFDAEAIRREILEQGLEGCRIELIDAPIVDISSTEIREREAAGDDMSGFLM